MLLRRRTRVLCSRIRYVQAGYGVENVLMSLAGCTREFRNGRRVDQETGLVCCFLAGKDDIRNSHRS